MGIEKKEDIRGYRLGDEVMCDACALHEGMDSENDDEIISAHKHSGLYVCDRCKKQF